MKAKRNARKITHLYFYDQFPYGEIVLPLNDKMIILKPNHVFKDSEYRLEIGYCGTDKSYTFNYSTKEERDEVCTEIIKKLNPQEFKGKKGDKK